jgi:8-oxo-dGTP pyrophosphatase MutT (NUDIX family)
MGAISVVPIADVDLRFEPRSWEWADRNRAATDAQFARVRAAQPAIWNGRVLLLYRFAIANGVFTGAYLETDFASFLHWRDAGFPDRSVWNCFAMGALRAGDGAYVLGRMASHTANAGKIYFPSGTPDPDDVGTDGAVDLFGSVRRELLEETGLSLADAPAGAGWHAVLAGARIALMCPLQARDDAETLRARIRAHLAAGHAELADAVIVRGQGDFSAAMPDFVRAYLDAALA